MPDPIEIRRDGAIATVLLNRPDRMNALNLDMWRGLTRAFQALAADQSLRAVVLRGAGTQAFAPGADISEFDTDRATAAQAEAYDLVMREALAMVRDCPHPVVAMIHGACVGGGLELAAQADLRISGQSGRFGVPVGRISVVMAPPEIAGIQRLVGPARMAEILLEARVFDAAEALSIGLLHRVVADDQLEDEVGATLKRITANAPLVNRWHKAFVRAAAEGASVDAGEAYRFLSTADYREGIAAFKEKRKPAFVGA
ncbi:MAG: enoyl-CoA hydratase/isomerase family protein [Alphaproteobacteria bacterium]|nr:enoyl-CoA hydratase/isomerase family protein [Alphaproteobacteria bacterium]